MLLAAMLVCFASQAAHAYEYVTLSGTGCTSDYLNANCSGKHVKIEGNAFTMNIYNNVNLAEVYAPNTEVTIIVNNGAKLIVSQDERFMTAVNAKSLVIRGNGYVNVIGSTYALGLHGGQLVVENSSATFKGLTEDAIVAKNGSYITFSNSAVNIEGAKAAVDSWEEGHTINLFSVDGDNSNTIVKGPIWNVNTVNIGGGYYNQIDNYEGPAISANQDINFTGGRIYVTEDHQRSTYACVSCHDFNASNCTLEVIGIQTGIYCSDMLRLQHANVRTIGQSAYGIMGNKHTGTVKLEGTTMQSNVLAVGGIDGINTRTVIMGGYKLVARGNNGNGITALTINIAPSLDNSIYEAYGTQFPILAKYMTESDIHEPSINLLRPTEVYGMLSGHEGIFPGVKVVHDDFGYFGLNSGTPFSNYVRLRKPNIQTITGANNPFLLRAGSGGTKEAVPGDTMQVNLSPLLPYVYTTYETLAKTVRVVRRNPTTGTSAVVAEEEVAGSVWSYTFTEQDVNCYMTAEVTVDGYLGELATQQYYVHKLENWNDPVKPTLALSAGKINVTNARSSQEYILLNETQFDQFVGASYDESWWQNAVSPTSNGSLTLNGGTQGAINYVVTRYKETATYLAGYRRAYNTILFDTNTLTKGLNVALTPMGSNFVEMEYLDGHVTYTTKKNGVVKLTVNPVPANATDFPGICGKDFSISAYYDGSTSHNYCALYANSACTTPLNDNTRYTTVYMKPLISGSNQLALIVDLFADGGEDPVVRGQQIYLNVSEDDGSFLPYQLFVNNRDTLFNYNNKVEGIPFTVFPARATLPGDVKVKYYTVQGPFPSYAGQAARLPSFTVDKANRTITLIPGTSEMLTNHTYSFTVYHQVNGVTQGYDYLKVRVVEKPIYSLNIEPAEAEVAPGGTLDLTITSNMEEAWRQYNTDGRTTVTSSNEEVATVAYDNNKRTYVVTMTDNEDMMGESAVITLNVNGVEATCRVTVNGERYPLWIAGTQVNTNNAADVLGDGTVTYVGNSQGGTLTLRGNSITGSILSEIPALVVDVHSAIAVSGGARFDGDDTYFTGDGLFESTIGGSTTSAFVAKNLTVDASVIIRTWCNAPAFVANNLTVAGDNAAVQANSYKKASMYVYENLFGTITQPAGAVLNPTTGWVAVGSNNLGTFVTNAYVYVTGITGSTVLRGDVNGDGVVSGADVTALYNVLLDNAIVSGDADVNGDGVVSGADVTALYNILLQ